MTDRCSPQELFFLRNNLPIWLIITAILKLTTRSHDGTRRFECPLCHGYDTASNSTTNLARCFDCKKNFNPIDLVMLVRSIKFTEAIAFLRKVRTKLSENRSAALTTPSPTQRPPALAASTDLTHIGEILNRYKIQNR